MTLSRGVHPRDGDRNRGAAPWTVADMVAVVEATQLATERAKAEVKRRKAMVF
jgi:hypothetical protein